MFAWINHAEYQFSFSVMKEHARSVAWSVRTRKKQGSVQIGHVLQSIFFRNKNENFNHLRL